LESLLKCSKRNFAANEGISFHRKNGAGLKKAAKSKTVLLVTTKVSSKGQIVLPASVRRKLALQPGDALKIRLENGARIIIEREPTKRRKMKIVIDRVTGWPVLKGPPGTPKLTSAMVKEMLADFP
jgi:AbrB family looped-hinge helix DNA binding protein